MAIASSDLELRLTGGSGNTSPAASLGGTMSTAGGGVVTSGGANNVFDDVSGAEASAGRTEYRGLAVKNNHGSLTLVGAVLWIDSLTSSPSTEFDIGLDAAAVGSESTTTIANETTAPAGVTFSRPTSKATGLLNADIPAGSKKAFWIRRTVSAGAAAASDSGSIRLEGDTAP